MRTILFKVLLTLIIASFTFIYTTGQQFGWRGPDRSGVYYEIANNNLLI